MAQIIFIIIIAIIILDFCFERWLEYLNAKRRDDKLPTELEGIYDSTKYLQQQNYEKINFRFSLLTSTFSFGLILAMLLFNGFAIIDTISRGLSENTIFIALIFFGILMFASDILSTPFSVYHTFVIEEKFGFNKTTPKTFFFDKMKGWLLTALIGGGLLSLIIWLFQSTGEYFWLFAWSVVSGFMFFMALFYSSLIVPLFNKQKPLEEGALKTAIQSFCNKVGYKLKNVYVIDGSKRSTKANAYFTGFGKKKRIALYDTLINDLSTEEIVAVLAHEIGPNKKKHTVQSMILSVLQTGIILFIFSKVADNPLLSQALGAEQHGFHLGLITFGILFSPISFITGIGLNILSRKNEYEADAFATINYNGLHLISALKKLTEKNLSNLTPHPVYVFFHYSHPTLLERIRRINAL